MSQVEAAIEFLTQFSSFRGNSKLRGEGTVIEYTKEMILEYQKCASDPIYFIKKYIYVVHPDKGIVKLDLYDYQEKMIDVYHGNKKVIFLTARQMGKCLINKTMVKIKNKTNGKIIKLTLGELYEWQKFKKLPLDEGVRMLQERISNSASQSL